MKPSLTTLKDYLLPAIIVIAGGGVIVLNLIPTFTPKQYFADGKKAYENENYVQAIRDLAKAQQYCETDIATRFLLGAAYQNYGWNDEALSQYETTWRLAAINGGRARHKAGRILFQNRQYETAVEYYRQALTLLPDADNIWFDLGLTLQLLNRQTSAYAAFQEAFKLNPNNNFYRRKLDEFSNNVQPK